MGDDRFAGTPGAAPDAVPRWVESEAVGADACDYDFHASHGCGPSITLLRKATHAKEPPMSLGLLLLIVLVIAMLGGFSGRIGGYGYGYGHSGIGVVGIVLIIVVVMLLTGRL